MQLAGEDASCDELKTAALCLVIWGHTQAGPGSSMELRNGESERTARRLSVKGTAAEEAAIEEAAITVPEQHMVSTCS